ncbi:hypothetical protein Tco_1440868 [Tanacetum coccineum]
MAAPPSPNHVFDFSEDDPGFYAEEFEDSDLEFEEDPQEEDEEMNEHVLIFPYEGAGSPKPPPPESFDYETEMTTKGDHVQRVVREEARVENIRLKRELEAAEISNTLIRMRRERAERELYHLRAWTYDFYEEMVQAVFVGERPSEAIDVLAVFGESQPPKPQGPPYGSQ